MTDNKRVTNKQILDKIDDLKVGEEGLNLLAIKIVSRMVKLKSMETWFDHVSKSDIAWSTAYKDLDLSEEVEALGEAAKLMTLLNICQEDEEYEKCAIIKGRMDVVNKILRKYK
jgi:putative NIF3 family GTP cyclohydrolase 1 type 2